MKINKYEKILVAGAKGMLGKAVVKILKKKGYKNILSPSKKELNFLHLIKLNQYFKKNKPKYIIMCAAKVGGIKDNQINKLQYLEENLKIQDNFFKIAKKYKTKKNVFIGSSCIYPKKSPQPIKETSLLSGKLEETNEGYALAKIIGIKKAEYYFNKYGLLTICPILCNIYGTNDNFDPNRSHVLSALVKKFVDAKFNNLDQVTLWGTGKPEREFMHVNDAAEALTILFERYNFPEIINVGSGTRISIKNLSKKIAKYSKYEGKLVWDKSMADGMMKKYLNISKLKKLKFKTKISIDTGIKKTIYEYKKNLNKINT